jgi:AmiR/NasT family two-component response regulator
MIQPLQSVAFVDDEPGILQVLRMACEAHYQVIGQGCNGLEAVTLVKTLKPQVLVLDLHMPVMEGLEALRQIVPLETTAVVILTADQDPKVAREAMDLGACGYVTKPFDLSQIIPMLETAWHRFQSTHLLREEVTQLSDSLETRKLLERAKGILIEQQGFTEEQAHKMLQKMSQDQAISLKEVCRSIIQIRMVLGKTAQQRKAV